MPTRTLIGSVATAVAIVIAGAAYSMVAADRNRRAADITELSEGVLSLQRLRVRALGEGDRVRLLVENDGPPIPPESVRSIFDPFQRASGTGADGVHAGVGLGLFIVRSIVEAHGGTVDVESAPERSVTFTVRLPRRPRPAGDAAPASVWRPTDQRPPRARAAGE